MIKSWGLHPLEWLNTASPDWATSDGRSRSKDEELMDVLSCIGSSKPVWTT